MKIQVIVNSSAGKGKGGKKFPFLEEKFKDLGLSAECTLSHHPHEARTIAFCAQKKGVDLLVACGGDGTIHSLLPAVVNRTPVLGIIPFGTANDLARNWDIPLDLSGALELLTKGQPRAVDVIATHSGAYIAGAGGVGFDVAVIERVSPWKKKWRGLSPYVLATLLEFFRYQPPWVSITAGHRRFQGPAWQVIFTKIPRYGLFLKIAPPGKMRGGLMEICLVPAVPKSHVLARSLFFPFLGFQSIPATQFFSSTRVSIESSAPLRFHGDGELLGHTPEAFWVLPKALRVMMPRASKA